LIFLSTKNTPIQVPDFAVNGIGAIPGAAGTPERLPGAAPG